MSTIMQPRFYEDRYAIGRFVLDRAKVLGLGRTDLVRRLGYGSLSSGHRALTALLVTGNIAPLIAQNLAAGLEVEQELIDAVLLATAQQRHDEARTRMLEHERRYGETFRPHLQIQTERRVPSPIFVAALLTTERLRIVRLPAGAFDGTEEDRDRVVKRVVVEHYRRERGHVHAFGAITGYDLLLIPGYGGADFGLAFDVDGHPSGPMHEVRRLPDAELTTRRGRPLTGLLKNTPIEVI